VTGLGGSPRGDTCRHDSAGIHLDLIVIVTEHHFVEELVVILGSSNSATLFRPTAPLRAASSAVVTSRAGGLKS
jgi:hypothetical protein